MTLYPGRGAWSPTGKRNKSRFYEFIEGLPVDGGNKDADYNYYAVHRGVRAIQDRLNQFGAGLTVDGYFGNMTKIAVENYQRDRNLAINGRVTPGTANSLFRGIIVDYQRAHGIPGNHLGGIALQESLMDPGAVGALTPDDKGLFQWNLKAHPDLTQDQAFNPVWSVPTTAKRLADARRKYGAKGTTLQMYCSIAQHNSPALASRWYTEGQPPNSQIASYVNKVLNHAAIFGD